MRRVNSKKLLALLLACLMVLTLTPFAFAEEYGDVTEGSYAEGAIDRWTEAGVVGGDGEGHFMPDAILSRAQGATIVVNLLRMKDAEKAELTEENGVAADQWYTDYMAVAKNAKIMNGDDHNNLLPLKELTREEYFAVICNALGIKPTETADEDQKEFPDKASTEGWAEGYVNALLNMGVIGGVPVDGVDTLAPLKEISRAEVMSLLDNMIGGYAYEDGQVIELKADENKITLVVADNVTIKGQANQPIVVAVDGASVDLKDVTGDVEVIVKADDVELTNVPAGTVLTTPNEETTVTVNGNKVDLTDEKDVTVEAKQPSSPSSSVPAHTPTNHEGSGTLSVYSNGVDAYILDCDTENVYILNPDTAAMSVTMDYDLVDDTVVLTIRESNVTIIDASTTVEGVKVDFEARKITISKLTKQDPITDADDINWTVINITYTKRY